MPPRLDLAGPDMLAVLGLVTYDESPWARIV
jgi:hypothetical protein